jgi:hypothetical protein
MTDRLESRRPSFEEDLAGLAQFRRYTERSSWIVIVGMIAVAVALLLMTLYFATQSSIAKQDAIRAGKKAAAAEHLQIQAQASEKDIRFQLMNVQNELDKIRSGIDPERRKTIQASLNTAQQEVQRLATANRALGEISVSGTATAVEIGSPTGWDVDIFWCQGPNDKEMSSRAITIQKSLAELARKREPLAAGVSLGKIRLRPLTAQMRQQGSWFDTRDTFVYDKGAGDAVAAAAMQSYIQQNTGLVLERKLSQSGPTKWYVSAMVCKAT